MDPDLEARLLTLTAAMGIEPYAFAPYRLNASDSSDSANHFEWLRNSRQKAMPWLTLA